MTATPGAEQGSSNNGRGSWNTDDTDRPRWNANTRLVAEYDYKRADGTYAYTICKGVDPDGTKRFKTERKNLTPLRDRFTLEDMVDAYPGLGNEPPVLYRLPELIAALQSRPTKRLLILEGEKDVETAIELDYVATCNPFGALKWRDEFAPYLADCDVVIIPDKDERGSEHAAQVVASIKRHALRHRILRLPEGKDLTEWKEAKQATAMHIRTIASALHNLIEVTPSTERLKGLGVWDAGDDTVTPPPRGWLLGNTFCRKFMSSLIGDGGVGKTALRYAQALSLAIGRKLTDEHVFERCRVLIISLEDDADELRRRISAAVLHHRIDRAELKGWLFLSAPGAAAGKLLTTGKSGKFVRGEMEERLIAEIVENKIDLVMIDPFVKSHSVEENANAGIDMVAQILTDLAAKHNIAVDAPHHVSKGVPEPGNADRGRGASAMKDAARLVYTLPPMSSDEAKLFGVTEEERRQYVRLDSGKVNITKYLPAAKWYRLVGVRLGNASAMYPHGDEVQTVVPWQQPDEWTGVSSEHIEQILADIEAGLEDGTRYSNASRAGNRAAWPVVVDHLPSKTEGQARAIIKAWIDNGHLVVREYDNLVTRKPAKGLWRGNPGDVPF